MVSRQIDINRPEHVHRTGKLLFLQPGQVAEIHEAEFIVSQQNSDARPVLRVLVSWLLLRILAEGRVGTSAIDRFGDGLAGSRDHSNIESSDWDLVPWLQNRPFAVGNLFIRAPKLNHGRSIRLQ